MFRGAALVTATLAALLGLLVGLSREGARSREAGRGPERAGVRVERCVSCHVRADEDPLGAHARLALGCEACHLGNRLAFGKERAHVGLEREPGALSTVARTCGREGCHAREAARVAVSPMARNDGLVAVDRWAFGEIPAPDGEESIGDVLSATERTPARDHLSRLCAGCHLGTRRASRDDAIQGNGSGCAACHVARRLPDGAKRPHPPVDSRVGDDRCLGCHSRSGRISLTYQGLAELEKEAPLSLFDGRPACRVAPDVHASAGMACVDCHLHTDLMGDGERRTHGADQVEVRCESCHVTARSTGTEPAWGSVRDAVTRDLLRLRRETRGPGEPVRLGARGTPLWNLRPAGAVGLPGADPARTPWALVGKLDGKLRGAARTPADADHELKGHERLSCSSCHAAWAPTCTTCHTSFDPVKRQWDFAAAAERAGAWVESSEGFSWAPPALGVSAGSRIVPSVPGMLMTLDARAAGGRVRELRLFAPLEPHSTGERARTCEECHRSAGALGLGSGRLDVDRDEPSFLPAAPAGSDALLARDGWTRLFPERPGRGTRTRFRSLDAGEQRRVVTVGRCLPCHRLSSDPVYRDFSASLSRLGSKASRCTLRPRPSAGEGGGRGPAG